MADRIVPTEPGWWWRNFYDGSAPVRVVRNRDGGLAWLHPQTQTSFAIIDEGMWGTDDGAWSGPCLTPAAVAAARVGMVPAAEHARAVRDAHQDGWDAAEALADEWSGSDSRAGLLATLAAAGLPDDEARAIVREVSGG